MKKVITIFVLFLLIVGGFFYFRNQVYYSRGNYLGEKMFEIEIGEGNSKIADNLKAEGFISGKTYYYYYMKTRGLLSRIMPGSYQLSGGMTIPEIAQIITKVEPEFVKITFPEGWTADQMAERLTDKGLPGEKFLEIAKNPGDFKKRYSYLTPETVGTLEGYLFPDTYFFKPDASAESIIGRMLDTFDEKMDSELREKVDAQNKTINDIVIMASIVEREVQSPVDMKTVAGIFWNRIDSGQRLQSDATLSYFLNDKIDQHSGKDLEVDSPYNTYRYSGFPPGPICSPGLNAIIAAIYFDQTDYNYFLTADVNGTKKVIYSVTFEEHVANKNKYGL
jgi:UPF0755 protein